MVLVAGDALAGATGVSGGSAHTVPSLLLSEAVTGRSLIELDRLLLRRIDFARVIPTFRTEEATSYEPSTNDVIPPEALAFNPPKTP